jgi:4-hydroxy-tetrahydrodipicolinate synthase
MMEPWRSKAAHALAPELVIWECDTIVYKAGWLQQGIVGPAQLGTAGYLYETPTNRMLTSYWTLIWEGRLAEAIEYAQETGLDRISEEVGGWFTRYPGRPDYFTHWGEAFRYAASVIGLPVGDYPHSRPPQGILPEAAKMQIGKTFENAGLAKQLTDA